MLDDQLAVFGESVHKECPRNVELEPGTVAWSPSVVKVFGKGKCLFDKLTLGNAFARGKKSDAARIGLENGTSVSLNWIHKKTT